MVVRSMMPNCMYGFRVDQMGGNVFVLFDDVG